MQILGFSSYKLIELPGMAREGCRKARMNTASKTILTARFDKWMLMPVFG